MVEEISESEIRAQLETNLLGALWVTQAALPYLRGQGSGHIVQGSSIGGVSALMRTGPHHRAKLAPQGPPQSVARERRGFRATVPLIRPARRSPDSGRPAAAHPT